MARALQRSLLGLATLLLIAAAVAAAASPEESTIESEDSAMLANEGRSLSQTQSCRRPGFGEFRNRCYCKPGYGWNARRRTCDYCPSGWYKSGFNFGTCRRCRSDYLVDNPIRSKCQPSCRRTNDFSYSYWNGYIAVAYPTYYYDWQGSGRRNFNSIWSAAEVCDSLRNKGYPNYVPAIVPSPLRGVVTTLARHHFKCYPRNWYYWSWRSANDDSLNSFGQCDRSRISTGDGEQFSGNRCFPSGGNNWKYPVVCSRGCARWCRQCESGRCVDCVPGYTRDSDSDDSSTDCTRDLTPFQEKK